MKSVTDLFKKLLTFRTTKPKASYNVFEAAADIATRASLSNHFTAYLAASALRLSLERVPNRQAAMMEIFEGCQKAFLRMVDAQFDVVIGELPHAAVTDPATAKQLKEARERAKVRARELIADITDAYLDMVDDPLPEKWTQPQGVHVGKLTPEQEATLRDAMKSPPGKFTVVQDSTQN